MTKATNIRQMVETSAPRGATSAALVLGALLGAVALGSAPVAAADSWYVSGNVGATFASDVSTTDTFAAGSVSADGEFDPGFGLSAALGYSFGDFRIEAELSYRENDVDQFDNISGNLTGNLFTVAGPVSTEAENTALGFMANGHYDFRNDSDWTPFVTAGVGAARVGLDVKSIGGIGVTYDENDTVLAYQVGAGVAYQIAAGTDLTMSYRFFATADPTFDDGTDKVDWEYQAHNIWVGIDHRF